jgi:hypothetical protein
MPRRLRRGFFTGFAATVCIVGGNIGSFPDGGSSGGGGGQIEKAPESRKRAKKFFENETCRAHFESKGLLDAVLAKARSATIVNLTNPNNSNYMHLTFGQIGFVEWPNPNDNVWTHLGPNSASGALAAASYAAQTVLLSFLFFDDKYDEKIRNGTFVHELMHLVVPGSHVALANRLGLTNQDGMPFDENKTSDHIAAQLTLFDFFGSDCTITQYDPNRKR